MTVLTAYIDFKSPGAYLGLNPVCELVQRLSVPVRWLPLDSRQDSVPAEKTGETRGETHRRVRALGRRQTHLRYAGVQGLPMSFSESPGGTRLALAALALLEDDPLPFIRGAFCAYWVEGANLDDRETVTSLWRAHVGTAAFDSTEGRARLATCREQALTLGVWDVPAFIVDEQIFIGREHLPWIEEVLLAAA